MVAKQKPSKEETTVNEQEQGRCYENSVLFPAAILSLVVRVLSGKDPNALPIVLSTLFFWVLFKLADFIRGAVISGSLTSLMKRHRDWSFPLSEKQNTRYYLTRWTSNAICVVAMVYAVWCVWGTNIAYNADTPFSVELELQTSTDGDLTYLIDKEAGNYESNAYVEVKDPSGVYRLFPGETLSVSVPYSITVMDATRFDSEMHTFCETRTVHSEEEAMDTSFEVVYEFHPEYYEDGELQPEADPLGICFTYTINTDIVYE